MGWRDLLEEAVEVVSPWVGNATIRAAGRIYRLRKRPPRHGWHTFVARGRDAEWTGESEPQPYTIDRPCFAAYLVGDRIVPNDVDLTMLVARFVADDVLPRSPDYDLGRAIARVSERVHLLPEDVDVFERVEVCAMMLQEKGQDDYGPYVYVGPAMPTGPEPEVREAFIDRMPSLSHVKGVDPRLDATFRLESLRREWADRRRKEIAEEARRRRIAEQLGSAEGRREMARLDFDEAAKAALAVSGAELLDARASRQADERVVRFRWLDRRFECVVDAHTLAVVDAGICLTAHDDDEFEDGTKGDTWLSLEALPGVIAQADRDGKLVVFRHVG